MVLIFCGFTFGPLFDAIILCLLHVSSLPSLGSVQKTKTARFVITGDWMDSAWDSKYEVMGSNSSAASWLTV